MNIAAGRHCCAPLQRGRTMEFLVWRVAPCTQRRVCFGHPHPHGRGVRTYMDVHQRPSHSGMFVQPPLPKPSVLPPPPKSESSLHAMLAARVVLAVGAVHCWTEYVADITLCEGPSMSPTIRPSGEIIVVDKHSIRWYGVQDGLTAKERERAAAKRQRQFVPRQVWHHPMISVTDLQDQAVKFTWYDALNHVRSPLSVGDVVVTQHPSRPGTVCKRVTGLPGDEILQAGGRMVVVPDGHVWLEGDNPANSSDSRTYGALPIALVQGRVLARLWPIRGHAWMLRGGRPHQPNATNNNNSGSVVLPAGYNGEHIVKHLVNKEDPSDV